LRGIEAAKRFHGLVYGNDLGVPATDVRLNRIVALKVSAAELSGRFEREARIVAALNHPNICQLYDIAPHMLIMEYVVGTPVVAAAKGPLGRAEALKLALQMVVAIEAAHAAGIVHRDLKPANILVTRDGNVKLLDFGIAKQNPVAEDLPQTDNATVAGLFMGSPAYMSPEVAEGRPADARSDIFCVLHSSAPECAATGP
jgi:eukaryotic-like serine/threonine-protein kinase